MDNYFLTKRQRYDDLKAQFDMDFNSFRPQYQELNDYFLPTRGRFQLSSDSNRGDKRNGKIIDPAGYMATRTLGSGMQAGVTSQARPWKRLSTSDPDLAEYGPVREWLDVVDNRMSTLFSRSNLYNVLPMGYCDLGVFGTSATLMDKDADNVSYFMSFPLGSYRIGRNYRGQINTFYREWRMTVRQLISNFGMKDGRSGNIDWSRFSQTVKNLYDRNQMEAWVPVAHVIEPNEMYVPGRLESKFKAFSSCYYEMDSSASEDRYLRESGYDYFPVLVPRWQVTGMDVYGTDCPGMISLGMNKGLQHGHRRRAQAIDKMVNPALKASSGLKKTRASIVSGDITYLDDPTDRFEAVHEVRIDITHLNATIEDDRNIIRTAFYEDLFLALTRSDRRQITATEIAERKEEKLLALGPVLEQLNQDLLNPLIDNQFLLMEQAGLIPPAPPELQGQPIKVEMISVMAQAQKAIGKQGLDSLLNIATALQAIDPSVIQKFDTHEYFDQYADSLGISSRIIRSDEKVQEIQAGQAEAQNKQAAVDNAAKMAGAAKNLSQARTDDPSLLSNLLEQAKGGQLVQP